MEYFRIINKQTSEIEIQENITPSKIDLFTESMLFLENENNFFKGITLWGEFNISYHKIIGGIRFTLLNCPNALSWTITTGFPPEPNKIVLHCTINRTEKASEFVEEIQDFLDEWETGLLKNL